MANIRFLYTNKWRDGVVTASSSAPALPAANTQDTDRTKVWRSTSGTGVQTIDIDLGAAQEVSAVAMANAKVLGTGTITLQSLGSSVAPGAPVNVVTLPVSHVYTKVTYDDFVPVTARHWRLEWSNPTAANDYAEVGYVFLGTPFEPSINVTVPMDSSVIDPTIIERSPGGQRTSTVYAPYAVGEAVFTYADETDRTNFETLFRTVGVHTPFFMILDDELAWTHMLIAFNGEMGEPFEEAYGRYTVSFTWEEAR